MLDILITYLSIINRVPYMKTIPLEPGVSYKIQQYRDNIDKSFRRKLLSMGMIPGLIFDVVRIAPMKGPIQITFKGSSLSFRMSDLLNGLEVVAQARR